MALETFATIGGINILDAAQSLAGSVTVPVASENVALVRLGSIAGSGDEPAGRAESVAFDAAFGRAFTTNAALNRIDIFQIGPDGGLTAAGGIDMGTLPDSGTVNSVAVGNGVLAVAYESETPGQPGRVALFASATGDLVKTLVVGVLPDQLTFSTDGSKLLVANEGEALSATDNAAGTVSIIDLSGGAAAASVANTISFAALDGSEGDLFDGGLALFPGQGASADVEPEYITVSPDGTRAYVTLQEVNAVAVIDLTDPGADRPIAILPLGGVDRNLPGNAFDPNDRDGINLAGFDVTSLLQPDAIASFEVDGATYFVTANEGDARVGEDLGDEVRLGNASYVLDPSAYPDAADIKAGPLGRLNVVSTAGDTDGDGDIDQITTFGGRGISIFRQNADGTIDKVRETGGEFEAIFAAYFPDLFNTEDGEEPDNRSDNKGPEPEGVTVGAVGGRLYAFVTLERVGGVMTYDVSDPANARFVGYTPPTAGDFRPEVVTFVSATDSPTGDALVLSANEESGTLTLYKALAQTDDADELIGGDSADRFDGKAGDDLIQGLGGDDNLKGGEGSDLLDGGAGDDELDGGAGSDLILFDNRAATGLDRVRFGADDLVVTTVALRDGDENGVIDFGRNRALDLGEGGVARFTSGSGGAIRRLEYDGSFDQGGVQYFVYSRVGSAVGLDEAAASLDLLL